MPFKRQLFPKCARGALHSLAILCLLAVLFGLFLNITIFVHECSALSPDEIIVVANKDVKESVPLALFYMKRRGIPYKNLVVISIPDKERCKREDFDKKMALPIRLFLHKQDQEGTFRCILTMYGVPLTIADGLSMKEKITLTQLQEKLRKAKQNLHHLQEKDKENNQVLKDEISKTNDEINLLQNTDRTAAVDSELALIHEKPTPYAGWVLNPAYLGYGGQRLHNMPQRAFLTSRLDGPSPEIVRRIVEDSLRAEKSGLRGKAYFDARWPDPGNKSLSSYAFYDRTIHRAAGLVRKSGVMPVVLDDKARLFQPGECPKAALYCGWYSLGKYVDAFTWVTGAVGYHMASNECSTLRNQNSTVWCKVMLEKGVAATIGPIGEPYLEAFPPPELFFGLLLDGRYTLAECFAMSNPFLSWKMILVGDPLYKPFKIPNN